MRDKLIVDLAAERLHLTSVMFDDFRHRSRDHVGFRSWRFFGIVTGDEVNRGRSTLVDFDQHCNAAPSG